MSRQRPSSASAVGRTPPSLVFRVPEGASAGTQIEFEKDGQKYRARVPEGVAPGGLFRTVGPKSLEQAVLERALTPGGSGAAAARRARPQSASAAASGQRRSQRPQSASAAAKKKWWEDEVKAKKLQAERDERRLSKFKLGGKPITEREYMMVQEYKRRRDNGEVSDEAYWKQFGFKFSGGQTEISAEAMRDYGYGIPKWSPYFTQDVGDIAALAAARDARGAGAGTLGDASWWEQYGFKGTISEEKKRDYGNGIPKWSPYNFKPEDPNLPQYVPPPGPMPPADNEWFKIAGFRTGGPDAMSEEKKRDYGFGMPNWSPHWVPDARVYAPPRKPPPRPPRPTGKPPVKTTPHFTPGPHEYNEPGQMMPMGALIAEANSTQAK